MPISWACCRKRSDKAFACQFQFNAQERIHSPKQSHSNITSELKWSEPKKSLACFSTSFRTSSARARLDSISLFRSLNFFKDVRLRVDAVVTTQRGLAAACVPLPLPRALPLPVALQLLPSARGAPPALRSPGASKMKPASRKNIMSMSMSVNFLAQNVNTWLFITIAIATNSWFN